ncbi:dihydrodipicolinate synthase [Coxiella endosymbiont of Amblyomma americanum]|uniref:4-hydroxy-tetrahydrodipicolinate synthase n=1 Tax=Coxiella-like endosymbiont of Amblyomma americanum TaxID=1987500 RepID=UPI00058002DB|nr:4-hydroxy-tetrahydrodipicolinate synthase [Coxiella endosymbiont of Amblyomma americanum]AJC50621.1 dihydrodipicolinate synthase [Coxiella endosymbiont of Amblyomma americanum]AUJ59064.1 4-hydroxy-tetrahydrodipicolinate synthase [Coxiella-like endosymbiont of Amblyomma americanum]
MFGGSLVAIVTPMTTGGEIDYKSFEKLIDWQLVNNTDGLVVLGSTGEASTITFSERTKIIQRTVDQVNKRIPVLVGTGSNSTSYTIELTRHAMEIGANAALIVTPYYNKPTQEGLFRHFEAVAKAVPIAQVLYNVPSRTACDLLSETILRLVKLFPNIVGIKDATGDIKRVKRLLKIQGNNQLDLISGDDNTAMDFMLSGGKGTISVIANILPKQCHDLCTAIASGKIEFARKCNEKLFPLRRLLFIETNPIPIKWVLSQVGMIKEGIRLPLTFFDKKYHDAMREAMHQLGIEKSSVF